MTRRIATLDSMRGWLILLVVLGHVFGAAAHLATTHKTGLTYFMMYKWIYLFHMSAFFFVSGMLFREWSDFRAAVGRLTKRLLVPYLVFGLLTLGLFWLVGSVALPKTAYYANKFAAGISWVSLLELLYGGATRKGIEPFVYNSVLWFLPALFSAEVLFALGVGVLKRLKVWMNIPHVSPLPYSLVLFSLVLLSWLVRKYCPVALPFGFARAIDYLPFFALGHALPVIPWVEALKQKRGRYWLWIPAAVVFTLVVGHIPDLYYQVLSFGWHLWFFLVTLLGIVMSILIAAAFDSRILQTCGMASLTIMLLHKPIVVALQFACPPVRALFTKGLAMSLVASLLVTLVSAVLCLLADRFLRRFAPWTIGRKMVDDG